MALEDKTKFGTFGLDSVKHSTVHRKEKEKGKKVDDKAARALGPADTIIHTREDGPTVQLCGDSEVAGKLINGQYSLGLKHRRNIWPYSKKRCSHGVEKEDQNSHLKD